MIFPCETIRCSDGNVQPGFWDLSVLNPEYETGNCAGTGYTSSTNSRSLMTQSRNNKSLFPYFTVSSVSLTQTQRLFPGGWADSPSNSWVQFWKRNILIISNAELCFCVFMLTTQRCSQPSSRLFSQFATHKHTQVNRSNWSIHPGEESRHVVSSMTQILFPKLSIVLTAKHSMSRFLWRHGPAL